MGNENRWRVIVGDDVRCDTGWVRAAQAAWGRATRNRDGDMVFLEKNDMEIARVRPDSRAGHPWPDRSDHDASWNDVVKQITLLAREMGWDVKAVADAMTAAGLPTSRSRVDSLRGSSDGRIAEVLPAELVVMLQALLSEYRAGAGE